MEAQTERDGSGGEELERLLAGLSPALKSVWAKTGVADGDPFAYWLPLVGHAMDAADVAAFLWDNWLSGSQKGVVSTCFPEGGDAAGAEDQARTFVRLAAGLHDLGKISKPFARQAPRFADLMAEQGLKTKSRDSTEGRENRWMKHALAGAVAIEQIGRKLGWSSSLRKALATVAGGHHGVPLDIRQKRIARRERLHFLIDTDVPGPWQNAQEEFARFVVRYVEGDAEVEPTFTVPALVIVQGLVMVADWVSSSARYFPLTPASDRDLRYLGQPGGQPGRVSRGLQELSLPLLWAPHDEGGDATTLLRLRFGVPFAARPLQEKAVEAARSMHGPGLLIVEDAMGSGKTEASLLAAEILAEKTGCGGLAIALPTQATTNAMFVRLLQFLDVMLSSDSYRDAGEGGPASVSLLHGRAQWNDRYVELAQSGRGFLDQSIAPFEIDLGEGTIEADNDSQQSRRHVLVHPWLTGRHKAILGTFIATTVDHLLMGALQMKYLALRHLGLSGKVIVFDEVHASSEFMNVYAERILEWLGAYRVPVVMLSATLGSPLRDRMSSAYLRGLVGRAASAQSSSPESGSDVVYPRITAVSEEGSFLYPVAPALPLTTVRVTARRPEEELWDIASELASGGSGNILVLANTVRRAQAAYDRLRDDFGDAVRLVHARFTAADRMDNDQWLLETYGPTSAARPEFSIVVATQVVEQSLDVDFDVLVTDIAPIDLVLQRLGRVHRHAGRSRPAGMSEPVCHIVGVPGFEEEPQGENDALRGAQRVYGALPVLTCPLVLGDKVFTPAGAVVTLPEQIGLLVERAAVGDFTVPPAWVDVFAKAEAAWDRMKAGAGKDAGQYRLGPPSTEDGGYQATLDGWYELGAADPESPARSARARVRDGEEGLDVVLLREVDGDLYTMENSEYPHGLPFPTDRTPNRSLAQQALLGTVSIPAWALDKKEDRVIKELEERCWSPLWERSPNLSGQLFLPLDGDSATLPGLTIRYGRQLGLEVQIDR